MHRLGPPPPPTPHPLQARSIGFRQFLQALPLLAAARGCEVDEVRGLERRLQREPVALAGSNTKHNSALQ